MAENQNYFKTLSAIDMSSKAKSKNGLTYVPWSSAWAAIKEKYPDATYKIWEQQIDETGAGRPWFTDGKHGWTKVSVTVDGVEHTMTLPIMDMRNKAIPVENIDPTNANKSMMRCLVKCCAMHGLGMYVYEGEELPDEMSKANELRDECWDLVCNKSKLSDKAKAKVKEICNEYAAQFDGDIRLLEDPEVFESIRLRLLTVRK